MQILTRKKIVKKVNSHPSFKKYEDLKLVVVDHEAITNRGKSITHAYTRKYMAAAFRGVMKKYQEDIGYELVFLFRNAGNAMRLNPIGGNFWLDINQFLEK